MKFSEKKLVYFADSSPSSSPESSEKNDNIEMEIEALRVSKVELFEKIRTLLVSLKKNLPSNLELWDRIIPLDIQGDYDTQRVFANEENEKWRFEIFGPIKINGEDIVVLFDGEMPDSIDIISGNRRISIGLGSYWNKPANSYTIVAAETELGQSYESADIDLVDPEEREVPPDSLIAEKLRREIARANLVVELLDKNLKRYVVAEDVAKEQVETKTDSPKHKLYDLISAVLKKFPGKNIIGPIRCGEFECSFYDAGGISKSLTLKHENGAIIKIWFEARDQFFMKIYKNEEEKTKHPYNSMTPSDELGTNERLFKYIEALESYLQN